MSVYLPATAASRLIGLVRGVLLAWLIAEKSEFGLFQITLLAVNILNPLCSAGLNEAVARYVPQYETRHALRPFLARAVATVLAASVIFCAVAAWAAEPLGRFLFTTIERGRTPELTSAEIANLTRLVVGTTFALISYFLLLAILKGLRMFRAVSLMELVNNLGFALLVVVSALTGWNRAGAFIACYGLTLLLVVMVFTPPVYRMIHRSADQDEPLATDRTGGVFGQLFRFSLWAALAAVMWQTLQYFPMWYLQKASGPDVTAVFGGVRHLTQIVLVGAVAVVTVIQTAVTKIWETLGPAEADRRLSLAYKTCGLLMIAACAVIAAFAGVIIRLFPSGYADGADIIPLSLLFFLVGAHLSFLAIHFNLIERTRFLFWPWSVGVVMSIAFSRQWVRPELEPVPALRAAAWAGVGGVALALVTCLVLMRLERRPFGRGALLIVLTSGTLAFPVPWTVAAVVLLLVVVWTTEIVFSQEEQRQLRQYRAAGWAFFVRTFLAMAPPASRHG